MTPIQIFDSVWERVDMLAALHAYLSTQVTAVLKVDELLRSEWVARVAALDLYVHEVVAQRMLKIQSGDLPATPKYLNFRVSMETQARMVAGAGSAAALGAFDLAVREQLGFQSFQSPDKISDALKLCSQIDLWSEVATHLQTTKGDLSITSKSLRNTLSAIASRRHKIAHEADLQPTTPREPWPISVSDLELVRGFIGSIVPAIDEVITQNDVT